MNAETLAAIEAHNARLLADIDRSHYRALAILAVPVVAFLVGLVALAVVVLR